MHLDNKVDQLIEEGMPASEARSIAMKSLGGVEQQKERLREVWQFRTLENVLRDMSFAARLLRDFFADRRG